jgi:hypothetical protein
VDGLRGSGEIRNVDWQDAEGAGHRRKFTRREVRLQARLRAGTSVIAATTENISPGGAFLSAQVPAGMEDVVATIQLPHGRGLQVRAKVRWRREEPPGVGIEFASFLD